MENLITVVSLQGQAWAVAQDGSRRELKVGDTVAADEMVVTADGARIDVQLANNQVLTLIGEHEIDPSAQTLPEPSSLSQPLTPISSSSDTPPQSTPRSRSVEIEEGHGFVQLVRIAEIIEADGFTPLTVARIQEIIKPLGMVLPERDFEQDRWKENVSRNEHGSSREYQVSINIDVIAGDDIVNAAEAERDITVTGTVSGDVNPGDKVTVTVNGKTYEATVNPDGKTWEVDVPGSELVQDKTVEATVTGNTPTGEPITADTERPYEVLTELPKVEVELEGAGPDGVYNESEIINGKVPAKITLDPNTVKEGDILKVTTPNGDVLLERPVTQDDIDNGVPVQVPVEPGQETVIVEATITNPEGNTGTGRDEKPVDNITPTVEIQLEGSGPDGVYNESEIVNGEVPAQVTLDKDTVKVGDTLVVKTPDGNVLLDRPVTQDDIDNGVPVQVPVTPGQTTVTVEATITDPAGNSSSSNDTKPVDNVPPVLDQLPNQEDEDADNIDLDLRQHFTDNKTPADELEIIVEGLPEGLEYDPVTGKVTGEIDKSASQNGPSSNGKYPIKVTVTDKAGNTSEAEFEWTVTNPPPVATDDTQTIDEDTVATGNVIKGTNSSGSGGGADNDPDGDELKVTEFKVAGDTTVYQPGDTVTIPNVGELTLKESGDYTFTPVQDWNGTVPDVNYTISDGEGGTSSADLKITVTPVNDAPEAVTPATPLDQEDVDADSASVTLDLENLFSDVDNTHDELTFTATGLPPGLIFNPATGEITGTIDRSASQGGPNNDGVYEVTVTATDPGGLSADQNFTWTVTNPAPEAENDAGETLKSARLTKGSANGVLENDSDPDGDPLFVQDVTNGTDTVTETNGELVIEGDYGTLVLQPDGSYVYTPDLTNDTVWELRGNDTPLKDSFTYTVSDGEGGTAEAELVITINGHSNTPPFLTPEDHNDVGGAAIDGHVTVHEKGLDDGTDPGQGHKAEGKIQISAMDGLTSITIAGTEVLLADLQDLANTPVTINVAGGELTLTGFDPLIVTKLGVDKVLGGDLKYTYELTADQDHPAGEGNNSLTLDIQLGVKDDQDVSSIDADNQLIVNVIDDVPSAEDDVNQITEDATDPAEGNVLTNDTTGADGATVTKIEFDGQSNAVPVGGAVTIAGEYGTLTIQPDGSYSYALDNSNLDVQGLHPNDPSLTENFKYTIKDGDGDEASANLVITINGANDGVEVNIPTEHNVPVNDKGVPNDPSKYTETGDQVVFESGLSTGSKPDGDAIKVDSSFTVEALDGLDPNAAVIITYKDENGNEKTETISKSELEGLAGTNQTITTQYGKLVLKGYDQDTDGTISIDYEYTLINAPEVPGESTNDDFTIKASDRDDDEDTKTLSIKIIDDAPTAKNDANEVTAADGDNVTASTTTGNVIGTGGTHDPSGSDVTDTTGADGATVTEVKQGAEQGTADGSGNLVITGEYGTLTIQPDGSYSYELDNNNQDVQKLHPDDANPSLIETFNYTITDGDGDTDSADLVITIKGNDDGVTVTVPDPNDPADPNYPAVDDPTDPNDPARGDISDHVVFESGLADGSSPNTDDILVKSSFTLSALDGLSDSEAITFAVVGETDITLTKQQVEELDTTSQTITTEHGELVLNGYSQAADGTITIDYEYTLTSAPENTTAGDGSDADKFTDDTISITVNDRDTDSDEQNLVIRIMDDVPSIEVDESQVGSLEVDETDFVPATDDNFVTGVFTTTEGADGATTTYSLEVAAGTDSGLIDTATGKSIVLYQDGTDVVGRVEDSTGDVAFRIEIDATSGSVKLTQSLPLQHPITTDPNDPVSINNGAIKLHATAVDGDGDTVKSAGVEVGGKFTFRDDGPTIDNTKLDGEFVADNAIVEEQYLSSGSGYTDGSQLTVTKELPINFGADGAVNAANKTGLIFANTNTDALEALKLKSGTTGLTYALSADGHTITAKADSKGIFTIELKVAADGTPSYEFTLQGPLDHTLNTDGEKADNIVLPFDITATDGDGDSVDLKFKVKVVDDTPDVADRALDVDEDGSVSFSNADVNQTTTEIKTGEEPQHGTVTIGNDGTITYEPNEDYRGSDSYTYTVTTDGGTYDRTVNITVKPVADAPLFAVRTDGGVVVTPEDTEESLGLKLPEIKDKGGQGFGEQDYEDYSELLGAITLTPSGVGYSAGATFTTTGGKELTPKDGKITIVITDNSGSADPLDGYHVKGSTIPAKDEDNGVYYLTKEEYEAITAHPAEDRHENFDVKVSVKSYEVNGSGEALPDDDVGGTNGAESTQTITVDVHAVTDDVGLKVQDDDTQAGVTVEISGSDKIADITFDEDASFNLTNILAPEAFKDTDGSETRYLGLKGLPDGTTVTVGGDDYVIGGNAPTVNFGGTIGEIPALTLAGTETNLPDITITPPKDLSGDLPAFEVVLGALDSDSDSASNPDFVPPVVETDSVTINLHVKPVAGDVAVEGTEGLEDEPIAFLENIKVTDDSTTPGTLGEVITEVSFTVPADWTVNESANTWANNGQTWTMAPSTSAGWTGTWDGNKYTITFDGDNTDPINGLSKEARENILKEFTVTPPAHSSKDIDLSVEVTSVDHSIISGGSSSDPASKTETITVVVKPVAERVDTDSDGADDNDVTMNPSYVYTAKGEEDKPFSLGIDGSFKLSAGWSNEDGKWVDDGSGNWSEDTTGGRSEDTFALLTPYKTKDNDARPGAATDGTLDGSVFTYVDGDNNTVTLPFAGEPVKIPMQYLDSVEFKGPQDWSGVVKIQVQAGTIDYDEDAPHEATDLEVSGESWLTNLIIEPRADQVTLKVDAIIKTDEDVPVDLNIIPTSSDPSETFDVTIKGIPEGAKITYDSIEYEAKSSVNEYDPLDEDAEGLFKVTVGGDVSYILVVKNFDTDEQPTLTPPKDSNVTIELEVTAQSVDTLTYIDKDGNTVTVTDADSDKSHTLNTEVQVQGVPDEPVLTLVEDKVYTEDAGDQDSGQLKVTLSDLITKLESGETGVPGVVDNSETVTLRISGLPEGFNLENAGPALGGSGEGRVWVITKADLVKTEPDHVHISVPQHYSGTVKFTAQPVVTENDNPSEIFFSPQNVEFQITPVPEATLSISSNLIEDTIGELELMPVGDDPDEYISAVRIKVSDVSDKELTLSTSSDGTGMPTTENINSVDYYVFNVASGKEAPNVYVKGPANFSGSKQLDIEYEVTDPVTSGTGSAVAEWKTAITHTLIFAAVTDEIDLALDTITGGNTDAGVTTLDSAGTVHVGLKITQKPDADANNQPDADGSEKFIHVVVSGVPAGVSVNGAIETAPGEWLITVGGANGIPFDTAELTQNLEFVVGGYANSFEQPITITTYTQDTGAESIEEDSVTWTLKYTNNDGDDVDLPELELTAVNAEQTEDESFTLGEVITGGINTPAGTTDNPFNMTVTVRTTPDDETDFSSMTRTLVTENGQPVALWTKTVSGVTKDDAQTQLDDLLGSITVTPPLNANSNNLDGGTLDLDVNVAVHADGVSRDSQATPKLPVTPVTDNVIVSVSENVVGEGETIDLNISLSSENDADGTLGATGAGWTVVDDKVFIHIADGLDGELYVDGAMSSGSATAPTDAPAGLTGGTYYEVSVTDLDNLEFRPDAGSSPHQTGSMGVTAWVEHIENNDAVGSKVSTGTGSLTIVESNSGYEATITATGEEAQTSGEKADAIELVISGQGLVDSAEEVSSAYISGLPSGFTVYAGTDAASSTMANNAGNETWVVPVTDDALPGYIAILPPANWSGSLTGVNLTVLSGHAGLTPTPTELPITFEVTPVASGITLNPTLSFGDAGELIALNLNASMKDPVAATGADGDAHTELTELKLTGFPGGDKVQFFIGTETGDGTLGDRVTYDGSGNYTISGLTQAELDSLQFVHGTTTGAEQIGISARTYEVDSSGVQVSSYSAEVSATMNINISPVVATSGADVFLWDGTDINGFGGTDTVQLRFGDDLSKDNGDFAKLKNIEIIDMSGAASGANSIGSLTPEDVFNMTDGGNKLTILHDSNDTVGLDTSWGSGSTAGSTTTYSHTDNGVTVDLTVTLVD